MLLSPIGRAEARLDRAWRNSAGASRRTRVSAADRHPNTAQPAVVAPETRRLEFFGSRHAPSSVHGSGRRDQDVAGQRDHGVAGRTDCAETDRACKLGRISRVVPQRGESEARRMREGASEFTVTTDITSFQNDANQRAGSGEGRAGLALGTASSPVMYCARPKPNDQSCGPFSTYPMKTSSGATPTAPSRLAISA